LLPAEVSFGLTNLRPRTTELGRLPVLPVPIVSSETRRSRRPT